MKMSNRLMLLGGVVGAVMTAVSPAYAEGDAKPAGHHARMWQGADANQDGFIDRAEFDALRQSRFAAMDADADGIVSAAELKALHDKWRDTKAAGGDAHHQKMFGHADTSGDGRITADEWQAHALARFVRLDANGDGAITPDEMGAHHGRKAAAGGKAWHGKMGHHAGLDSDGDGQVTRLEWDAAGAGMFEHMDRNGDGRIEPAEFPRHRQKQDQAPAQP